MICIIQNDPTQNCIEILGSHGILNIFNYSEGKIIILIHHSSRLIGELYLGLHHFIVPFGTRVAMMKVKILKTKKQSILANIFLD